MISKYFTLDDVTFLFTPDLKDLDGTSIDVEHAHLPFLKLYEPWHEDGTAWGWDFDISMEVPWEEDRIYNQHFKIERILAKKFQVTKKGITFYMSLATILKEAFEDLITTDTDLHPEGFPTTIEHFDTFIYVRDNMKRLEVIFKLKENQ